MRPGSDDLCCKVAEVVPRRPSCLAWSQENCLCRFFTQQGRLVVWLDSSPLLLNHSKLIFKSAGRLVLRFDSPPNILIFKSAGRLVLRNDSPPLILSSLSSRLVIRLDSPPLIFNFHSAAGSSLGLTRRRSSTSSLQQAGLSLRLDSPPLFNIFI